MTEYDICVMTQRFKDTHHITVKAESARDAVRDTFYLIPDWWYSVSAWEHDSERASIRVSWTTVAKDGRKIEYTKFFHSSYLDKFDSICRISHNDITMDDLNRFLAGVGFAFMCTKLIAREDGTDDEEFIGLYESESAVNQIPHINLITRHEWIMDWDSDKEMATFLKQFKETEE